MKKKLNEYLIKYGLIPKNFNERFLYLIKELKLSIDDINDIKKKIRKIINAKWETIDLVFYFYPKATPRARYTSFTKTFYVKDAFNYSILFKEFVEQSEDLEKLITTPCKFYCDLFIPMPSQMSKKEKILSELKLLYALPRPDWDNAGKTYSDMVQKHLIIEDCLIIDGRVRKFYSIKPRIEMRIEYMEKYDCLFNKKRVEKWKVYKDNEDKIIQKDNIC